METFVDVEALAKSRTPIPEPASGPNISVARQLSHYLLDRSHAELSRPTDQDSSINDHNNTIRILDKKNPERNQEVPLANSLSSEHNLNGFSRLKKWCLHFLSVCL